MAGCLPGCKSPTNPCRSTRLPQVEKLHAALLGGGGAAPDALQAVLAGPLLVPLVRLLADPAEKCRELAAAFFAAALPQLPPGGSAALLPTLVLALAERVGSPPVQEASEEMRLALAELIAGPLLGAAPRPLPADLLPPLCATLWCQLQDPFADIKRVSGAACWLAGCSAAAGLCRSSSSMSVVVPHGLHNALPHPHTTCRQPARQSRAWWR